MKKPNTVPAFTRRVVAYERRLRKKAPAKLPVRVVFRKGLRHEGEKAYGCTGLAIDLRTRRSEFLIEIDQDIGEPVACDTLIHEWAHAVSWQADKSSHGAAWGVAYARCYRICVEGAK